MPISLSRLARRSVVDLFLGQVDRAAAIRACASAIRVCVMVRMVVSGPGALCSPKATPITPPSHRDRRDRIQWPGVRPCLSFIVGSS